MRQTPTRIEPTPPNVQNWCLHHPFSMLNRNNYAANRNRLPPPYGENDPPTIQAAPGERKKPVSNTTSWIKGPIKRPQPHVVLLSETHWKDEYIPKISHIPLLEKSRNLS